MTAWRLLRLLELGIPSDQAEQHANHRDLDIHELERLIQRGCDPATALRIVS